MSVKENCVIKILCVDTAPLQVATTNSKSIYVR